MLLVPTKAHADSPGPHATGAASRHAHSQQHLEEAVGASEEDEDEESMGWDDEGEEERSAEQHGLADVDDLGAMEESMGGALPEPTNVKVKTAEYISSCVNQRDCPAPKHPEFAVIGRSNVGKSSLINMLTNSKRLAHVSKEPGVWCRLCMCLLFVLVCATKGLWVLMEVGEERRMNEKHRNGVSSS